MNRLWNYIIAQVAAAEPEYFLVKIGDSFTFI